MNTEQKEIIETIAKVSIDNIKKIAIKKNKLNDYYRLCDYLKIRDTIQKNEICYYKEPKTSRAKKYTMIEQNFKVVDNKLFSKVKDNNFTYLKWSDYFYSKREYKKYIKTTSQSRIDSKKQNENDLQFCINFLTSLLKQDVKFELLVNLITKNFK